MMVVRTNSCCRGSDVYNTHNGKHFFVLGASSGIGAAIARTLAEGGASITLSARRKECLDTLCANLPGEGHGVILFDVAHLDGIYEAVKTLISKRGMPDGCVYSVGSGDTARLRDLTPERLHATMQLNFYAFVEVVRSFAKQKPKGRHLKIIAISSLASTCNDKYFTPYAASKAALEAAVRCLAKELTPKNITLNCIRPGVVDVERLKHVDDLTGGLDAHLRKSGYQPLGIIPPSEIGHMASYLLSDYCNYITGASLPFNGGVAC